MNGSEGGRAVGIDVGGTKIAAGLVETGSGRLLEREEVPTRPKRGGVAVLADCAALARALGGGEQPVGIGLCELVDLDGRPASAETVDWRDLDLAGAVGAPHVVLEADVRAAARAEAVFGAGAGRSPMHASHLHFMVSAPGMRTLVIHIFVRGDAFLASDSVFGVKESLVKDFIEQSAGTPTLDGRDLSTQTWTRVRFYIVLAPSGA